MVRRESIFDKPFFYFLSVLVTYDCELNIANLSDLALQQKLPRMKSIFCEKKYAITHKD